MKLKYLITYCLLCLATIIFAQKAKVELSISPIDPQVGETFIITITSTVQGTVDIDNLPSSYIQDYSIRQGSSQSMDYSTGNVTTLFYNSYSGVINKNGKYKIGPAYVKNGNKTYASNTVSIDVSAKVKMNATTISKQQLKEPAFGIIQTNKTEIYEGEPLLISSKVYSREEPTKISSYQSYKLSGTVVKHPIGNPSNIKTPIEKYKGRNFYTFIYDKNIVFPEGVGTFIIEPYSLNIHHGYRGFPILSSSSFILIKPLPANPPADFIGGVGEFDVQQTIGTSAIKQGEVFTLTVIVSGIGNLHNILEPKLNLPKGFIIYGDPTTSEKFSIGIHGTKGKISYEYNIQVSKSGTQKIPSTTISFFDLKTEKYVQVSTGEIEILIEKDDSYIVHEADTDEKSTEVIVKIIADDQIIQKKPFYLTPLFMGGVSIPLLSFILFLFFRKKKRKSEDDITAKESDNKGLPLNSTELFQQLNKALQSNNDDLFFSTTEKLIQRKFYKKESFNQGISNREILASIDDPAIREEVEMILTICEQSRYGFASAELSKKELLTKIQALTN